VAVPVAIGGVTLTVGVSGVTDWVMVGVGVALESGAKERAMNPAQ